METTLEDYLFRLGKYREACYENGNIKLGDFFTHLLSSDSADIDIGVYDVLYHNFDGLQETDAEIFDYFLSHNATKDWYEALIYVNEQRGGICTDYVPVIKRAFENGLTADDVINVERRTTGVEDFVELMENTILKFGSHSNENMLDTADNKLRIENEFIKHLKAENERVQAQYETASSELESLQKVHRTTIEEATNNKHIAAACRDEVDKLKKELRNAGIEKQRFEKKYNSQKSLVDSLGVINDKLMEEKKNLADEKHSLLDKIDSYVSERSELIEEKEQYLKEKAQLVGQRDTAIKEKEDVLNGMSDFEAEKNGILSRNEELEKLNTELTDRANELEKSNADIKAEFDKVSGQYAELMKSYALGISENERLSNELEELKKAGVAGNGGASPSVEKVEAARTVNIPSGESVGSPIPVQHISDFGSDEIPNGIGFDDGYGDGIVFEDVQDDENVIEYNSDELVTINTSKTASEPKKKIAAKSFAKGFQKFFLNIVFRGKSIEEQNNLLFAKLMDSGYNRESIQQIVTALRTKPGISRSTIFSLLQKDALQEEVLSYCADF